MFTPRGGLKPIPNKPNPITSNIDLGSKNGWSNDHFTTTAVRDNHAVSQNRLYVRRKPAPNKNEDSEPGLWGSAQDFPVHQTFTTTREVMDAPDKSQSRMRKSSKLAKSEMRLGYPEAEAKNPWKTTSMRQFKDPLLGARKKGPTALPQPTFPAATDWCQPITGAPVESKRANLFERYQRDEKKARISNDQLYKTQFNPSNSRTNIITGYQSIGKTFESCTYKAPTRARPTLNTLAAVRP